MSIYIILFLGKPRVTTTSLASSKPLFLYGRSNAYKSKLAFLHRKAVIAESIPPDIPTMALLLPLFLNSIRQNFIIASDIFL